MGHELIAITLFVCVTYAFTYLVKALLDARSRSLLVREGGDKDLLRSIIAAEAEHGRLAALRWGIALCALALGFALIQWFGWRELTPGAIAVLVGSIGLGQLAFYAVSARRSGDVSP